MSNILKAEEVSQKLAEPEWLLSWRKDRLSRGASYPKTAKYGIAIEGVLPTGDIEFNNEAKYHVDASKELELYTWKEAVAQEEIAPILQGLLESEFFPEANDHYTGIAHALFAGGLVVYAQPSLDEKGEMKEERLVLDTLLPDGSASDLIVVIAKEGARLLIESGVAGGGDGSLLARTIILLTEREAYVRVTEHARLEKGHSALVLGQAIVAAHSRVVWEELFDAKGSVRSDVRNLLIGENAQVDVIQGVIANDDARFDIHAGATHKASNTQSVIRAAGVHAGTSKTVYRGKIDIHKGVSGVRGAQDAQFLVVSPKAEVDAIPSLDIASKDVECTHKLSVAHFRDTDLFYPKLRGLSDEESRAMFLEAMFARVFSGGGADAMMEDVRKGLRAHSIDTNTNGPQ